ncbi:hypothetical protein M406DRAFT_341681 [Cryphonectria parasitica EP155]|uniref:Uncharacterized protein n=1 Tax=Cryphonectria parasitica (strain ATCC 38755 / EP155) TaxID=660469 RepID=A0A9P4XW89_CRYP1|nr:uncharacterized protein M406DRAFT_341681 [Cryphonectria parasitica EP155]KAF3762457.1 hypothetical protein M406DRAFT_341681 [Cryphonectria parasitica EP155]
MAALSADLADLEISPRSISVASTTSHGSATTHASLGSDSSGSSRHSSASFLAAARNPIHLAPTSNVRHSTGNYGDKPVPRRRGYMRPTGTDFAASARSRESVMSLGSITHLQYYFARTGLLDGKGAQLARKTRMQKAQTLDFSSLGSFDFASASGNAPKIVTTSDNDSAYGASPDTGGFGGMTDSPVAEEPDEDQFDYDEWDEPDPNMLPPTASTYKHSEKPIAKPPSIRQLKADLRTALTMAREAVDYAKNNRVNPYEGGAARARQDSIVSVTSLTESPTPPSHARQLSRATISAPGWFEVQGMHVLDVMTLAIRAAKVYYTSHDAPDRLDSIKPEKELRKELFNVMEMLKRMATRDFQGGMRDDEVQIMEEWIAGLFKMLKDEEEIEMAEAEERASWGWLNDADWPAGTEVQREYAFIVSMLDGAENTTKAPAPDGSTMQVPALPSWTPIDRSRPLEGQDLPTPFLASLQNGLRLVQLHNAAVRKSRRRFGMIGTFHTDTQKPYRAADNIRYWAKAAELRWEVTGLKVDALGIVYNSKPEAWLEFEDAVLRWCKHVREEITADLGRPPTRVGPPEWLPKKKLDTPEPLVEE